MYLKENIHFNQTATDIFLSLSKKKKKKKKNAKNGSVAPVKHGFLFSSALWLIVNCFLANFGLIYISDVRKSIFEGFLKI